MKSKQVLFIFFIFSFLLSNAQYQSKSILLKALPQFDTEITTNPDLAQIALEANGNLIKVFPNHQSPKNRFDEYGNKLVNLNLWYQLNYQANISEIIIIQRIKQLGLFQFVERRGQNTLFYTPNDSLLSNQWYLNNIHAYDAWDVEMGDTNVVVGITDTGIDRLQEDLIDGIKYNYQDPVDGIDNDNDGFIDNFCGWDVGSNDNNVQWGPIGHGTFVAGFVSAVPDNGKGIAGVGYHIKTLPVKIDDNQGSLIHDYEGIVYAADHACSVINCSWGGPVFTQFGQDIINYATFNRDVLVVAACGNSNNSVWMYPAAYDNVLSVAATDSMDVRWAQSSYGSRVDLCAPGTFVYSTWVSNIYFSSHGTSFSAPMVAAAAALVKSHYPWMNALQLGEQVRISTDYIDSISGNIPTKDLMGSGKLNIYNALIDTINPSIRFRDRLITSISNNFTDTLRISGTFTNFLSRSGYSSKATIRSNSPYVQVIDSVFYLGSLATMTSISNHSSPFRVKILPGAPPGYHTNLKILYSDGTYSDFEFIHLELNKDYINIDTNKVTLTLTSTSRIGFNDDNFNQGIGVLYKGGRSMMSMGGLLIANGGNSVSDNIYSNNGFDHDFCALSNITEISNYKNSDQAFYCIFNDDSAGFSKHDIEVKQYSYSYNQADKEKFVILEYHIFNRGNTSLNGIYTSLFSDFDIEKSSANKAAYDASHNLAYSYAITGGKHIGIMLLEGKNPTVYNIDNDGSNGSVNIYDGFYDFEKFQAMTQVRDSAGYGNDGGDVSNMLSSGPYNLAINDSIIITYAMVVGDHLYDLKHSAQTAYDTYYNTAAINSSTKESTLFLYSGFPNPFTSQTRITILNSKKQDIELSIYDSKGQLIKEWPKSNLPAGSFHYTFNAQELKLSPGTYYVILSTTTEHCSRKLILVK